MRLSSRALPPVSHERGGVDSDRKNFGGVNPAILTDLYATDDDPAANLEYYRHHLGDGWVENAEYRNRAAATFPVAAGRRTLFAVSLQTRD